MLLANGSIRKISENKLVVGYFNGYKDESLEYFSSDSATG